jgi:iron complex transport system ATP-binding protein
MASFAGVALADWRDRAFARQVAYMPQFTSPADGMTVRELVALGRFPWHGTLGRFGAQDAAHVERALDVTGLSPLANRLVDTLSGGERQRAWLGVMLAQDTRCIILDEPTSALDVAREVEMLELMKRQCRERGVTVIVVLHDINLAARVCDDVVALRAGRLVAHGAVSDVLRPQLLEEIFGLPMGVMAHPTRGELLSYVL